MSPLLYGELTPWYRLIDPPADHLREASAYREALAAAVGPEGRTLLELGSGAGHNALHMKGRFACTLTEPSEAMRALSLELNPECEHLPGDMRTLRLGRTFDAVFVHDAVMYMANEADLRAALLTAFIHTRPGGAALIAPDCFRDGFEESSSLLEHAEGGRAIRGAIWAWDPDPTDDSFVTDYAFLLRNERGEMRAVHDRHTEGLFSRARWERLLLEVGFRTIQGVRRPLDDEGEFDEVLLARR